MTERDVAEEIAELVENAEAGESPLAGAKWKSFRRAGVLAYNEGFVLKLSDGAEYQVTVVQSAGDDE